MENIETKIPRKFWHESEATPEAYTVGELIAALRELPNRLPIESALGEGCQVRVFNLGVDVGTLHVQIEAIE